MKMKTKFIVVVSMELVPLEVNIVMNAWEIMVVVCFCCVKG